MGVAHGFIGKTLLVTLAFSSILFSSAVGADNAIDQNEALRLRRQGEIMALEDVLKQAKHRRKGKVIEIELESYQGQYVYEIELLDTKGIVWEMKFNAKTGRLLKDKKED